MQTVETLAERLRTDPGDQEAYQALKTLYRTQADYGSLANLVAGWAGWVGDDRAAASAYVEVGDLLAQHLAQHAQAESFYLEALRRDPLSLSACDALHALWEGQGAYVRLADFLQEQLQTLAQHGAAPKQLAVLRYRLGELWSKRLRATAEALHHYRKAIELDPTLLRAMYEARQLLVEEGDLRGAAELYEREAAAEPGAERKVALLSELGALCRDQIGDRDGAISALQRAHGLMPEDAGLSYELATLIMQRAEQADPRSAQGDYAQVAELMCSIAASVEAAQARGYLETALGYAPQHERALAALERLLEGNHQALELAPHWVAYIAASPDGPGARQRRVKLARAYAEQGQVDDAIFCLEPAAEAGSPAAVELLAKLRGQAPASTRSQTPPSDEAGRPATPAPAHSSAQASTKPRPRSGPPRAARAARASEAVPVGREPRPSSVPARGTATASPVTSDLDELQTVVAEPELIDSLREETADQRPAAREEMFDQLEEVLSEPQIEAPAPDRIHLTPDELQTLRRSASALAREQRQEEAAAAYEHVLRAEPLDREAFAFLDGFYRRHQQHAQRAKLLEHSAATEGLPARVRITRLREAASTYEARLKDYGAAIRTLHVLAEIDPDSDEVQRTLKRLLERAERWDELARVLEGELARTEDAEPKLPLLRRLASLHREKRADRGAAADVLERMLILKPDDRAIRDMLIEDLLAVERYDDVVPWLERKIEEAGAKGQKLGLLWQLAALCRDRLQDSEKTFEAYERLLALAPGDGDTIAQLLSVDEGAVDHERLLATLEQQVALVGGAKAAEILAHMARIAEERLDDRERSSELLSRAVDLAPEQPEYLRTLCELYEQDERFEDLVELLRERTLIERNPPARAELFRRIASVLDEHLANADGAREAWEKLLQIKEDKQALDALRKRALERDDPETLAKLLARSAALEPDPDEQRDLLYERAVLLLRRLARPAQAIPDLLRILTELEPGFEPAFEALSQAAEAADDFRALAQVLEQRLSQTTEITQRIEHASKLAGIYEHKLVDAERAVRALEQWSQAAPDDPEPHRRLCPLLARAHRYEQLLDALDALARLEADARARERAAIQAAEVAHARLNDAQGAWERLLPWVEAGARAAIEAAITLAQSSRRLGELYDLLERAGQVDRLLSLLRERSGREQDGALRAGLLRRIAQLLIEHKQDEAGAAEAYRRLLEIEEDVDALRFLQALAVRDDDPATLAAMLKRLAAVEPDADERRELLFEHARLLSTRLDRPAEAVAALRELLAHSPDFEPGIEELLRACELAHDHATLATTLEQMLSRTRDAASRARLAARLAEVCERELHDSERAVAALKLWADAEPSNPEPHRKLRPLLQAAGREHELLASLDALCAHEPQSEARIEATLAATTLLRNQLQDLDGAWQRLVPRLRDADPRIDRALYTLATDAQRQDELYLLLEQVDRYETLCEWLGQRISLERNESLKVELYRRMAHILAGPLGDEQGAADAWSRLLRMHEDAEALGFMRTLALRQDDMQLLGDSLRRLAALEQDPSERRDLLYEYGHLLRARLGKAGDAIAVLREVVERLDPDFEPALDELMQACEAVSDHSTLAWTLERVLARESDPDIRAEHARRLAAICMQSPSEPERAIAALKLWAEAAPNDAEPHRKLVSLLRGSERHAELVVALDAMAAREDDEAARQRALLMAATLAFERLGDADGAFRRLSPLALSGNPEAEVLLARVAFEGGKTPDLFAFYEAQQRYDDLVGVLRTEAERSEDPAKKADLYRRCARLLSGPLGDALAAAEAYREVLSLGEDAEALGFLREQAAVLDDPSQLCDILERLAALAADREQKRDLLFERALLLSDRLEQPASAASILRALLAELDPNFGPAIEELITISEASDDYEGLAVGLERQLALARTGSARAELAERLAGLYEDKLRDVAKTTAALLCWTQAEPQNPEPLRRLRPELERSGKLPELLAVLDALGACEPAKEARSEATLAAVELLWSRLGDTAGAWTRLSPLMLSGDDRAELAAQELASRSGQYRPLVNLYVLRAQQPERATTALNDWIRAAALYEQQLHEPSEALEADLRALALDMKNRALLDGIDRLAIAIGAWDRLWRVYSRLVQEAPDDETKVELLARNAVLLDQHGQDPAVALERILQACRLAPGRDDLLDRAEGLATRAGSHAELVAIYEALAHNSANDERRARQLLRAAKVADLGLKDREHAMRDIARALALTEELPRVAAEIEDLVRDLDHERPELGKEDARRSLIQAHMDLAQRLGEPFGPLLVLRASQLLHDELHDDAACFDALKQGAALFPNDLDLYDALERAALQINRLDALDAHLARCLQRAEFEVKRALLLRRAKLLADHLQRHAKAAEVYRELLALDPDNGTAFEALMRSLRQAGRYQDLLKLYNDRLARTEELGTRLSLMRQMAQLWEVELKNRPSAVELWRVVSALAPDDQEAAAALSRLGGP